VLVRFVILLTVSVAVFEARADALPVIVLAAAAAAVVTTRLPARAPFRLQPLQLLLHLPWFTAFAARGGVDVAVRALAPRGVVRPGFVDYDIRMQDPVARVMFANAVSLMPGTLTARLEQRRLRVHMLDERADVVPRLAALEQRVARVFGEALP
jgi:multicomponent Na+:H+ antiporter subunit E